MGTSMKQLTSRERPLVVQLALQTCKKYLLVWNIYYSSMIIKRVTRNIYIHTADGNGEHIFTLIFAHMYIWVIINPLNNCVYKAIAKQIYLLFMLSARTIILES